MQRAAKNGPAVNASGAARDRARRSRAKLMIGDNNAEGAQVCELSRCK